MSEPITSVCLIPASALLRLAEDWASATGCTLHARAHYTPVAIAAMAPPQAGLLAASCELFDLVCAAHGGAQAAELAGFALAASGDPIPQ